MQIADVVVLGAGMVGVSAALHLQARGRESYWSTAMARRGWKPASATPASSSGPRYTPISFRATRKSWRFTR